MKHYVQVVTEAKIPFVKNQLFTYETEEDLQVGQEVVVPFRSRKIRGIVWKTGLLKPPFKTKKILAVNDPEPLLDHLHFRLARWLSAYYFTSLGLVVKLMLPKRTRSRQREKPRRPPQRKSVRLTRQQRLVLEKAEKAKRQFFLLHGVTGSGKTEIYLRLCLEVIRAKKQAIILVPEISLTHQAIDRFSGRFPGKIALLHSRLSAGERFAAWQKIRSGQAQIIIGPRSAIFAPVRKLGLVVLDEEHDSSFKQYDQNPRYHAREVAKELCRLAGAKLVLGSATPSVETYYRAQDQEYTLLKLPQRIGKEKLPEVEIVDMRLEFKQGNRTILSEKLRQRLKAILAQDKQAILFMNRRGAATYVFCRDCGEVLKCPHCDVSLTYHLGGKAQLLCHYCNHKAESCAFCPHCQSPYLKYFGLGTQKIETEVKKLFPQARTGRFDRDATAHKGQFKRIYYSFLNHKIDILIGTQMLTQGWDLPKVALIGIISGEADLNLPDFRAGERTFQLLTQVAGRTGRGREIGQVVLQTYNPDHFAIKAAARHDYQAFYEQEIKHRQELNFPPFSRLVKLIYQNYDAVKAEKEAKRLAQSLRRLITLKKIPITLLGPAPGFIPRIRRRFQYHLILMFAPAALAAKKTILSRVPEQWIIDVDPESLL